MTRFVDALPLIVRRALGAAGRVVFNETLMQAAWAYVRAYFSFDRIRLWHLRAAPPEWYDQRANLAQFAETRDPLWAERGVYSRELVRPGDRVLDLCTGGGFYPFAFFSDRASHIDAVDWAADAIASAQRWHRHPKITFARADIIREPFPNSSYDVVIWDAAIEHFSLEDARTVLAKIRDALAPAGALGGYTLIQTLPEYGHPMHEHEYGSADELAGVLREFFPVVQTYENTTSGRHNIYFRAAFSEERLVGFR